jgi:hypothetical protein
MTTISIVPEPRTPGETTYRAIAGSHQSTGRTPGETLDAITSQLDDEASATLLIVQQMKPDQFFGAEQRQRLTSLMDKWRTARDRGEALPADDQLELERLVDEELEASAKRAEALLREAGE